MFDPEKERMKQLRQRIRRWGGIFDVDHMDARLSELSEVLATPGLWDDAERAQTLLKEQKDLETKRDRLAIPKSKMESAAMLIELAEADGDNSVQADIAAELDVAEAEIAAMEFERMLSGPRDSAPAILTINAGAGGTESQDWAEMLLRMYLRYIERKGWKVEMLDRQDAEDAGIKSVTLQVDGEYAYGLLKSESGVHRLVRISPFDSNARRQTSFAACFVFPDTEEDIDIQINENDLRIDTYRASGAGGQHVNKVSSAVRIVHNPTGIVVQCQAERSQHKNRDKAMKMLKARLYDMEMAKRDAEKAAIEGQKSDIAFGSQIRNYVLHPYQLVKDLRSNWETSNVQAVLDGELDGVVKSFLLMGEEKQSA
ncbi:MAG: peptide chain release factor 2 [Myxococcota bacterium]